MSDRMIVVSKVVVALFAVELILTLGGALGSLMQGQSPWGYLDDGGPIAGLIAFALLYIREREARRREQDATRE